MKLKKKHTQVKHTSENYLLAAEKFLILDNMIVVLKDMVNNTN